MNNREVASEWFEFAKRDLKSAEFLIDMHPRPIEIICYHCQQCAEKYLKGYIDDECIELVIYGVQVRYPYELEINDQDMRYAIECANKIEEFLESILKASN